MRRRRVLADPVELVIDFDRLRDEAVQKHGAWIYVSVDRETGDLVNAAGFWPSEADAGLAASTDPDRDSDHVVVPCFFQQPIAGLVWGDEC